ncbi:MAG: alkaline phosphatase D family protein [Cyclobacteriaceae bacterium]
MIRKCLLLSLFFFCSCTTQNGKETENTDSVAEETTATTTTIAFGSCAHEDEEQPIWQAINQHKPDLWIWLGDIVYGDTENMDTLKYKYDQALGKPGYQTLRSQTKVIGVYDDHDYGVNDGGKEYPEKAESKKLLFDFLDVSSNDLARGREGAYSSHLLEVADHTIKIVLLDTRYFRDALMKDAETNHNIPNPTGDILGEDQWIWLEEELSDPDADLFVIGSSIQVVSKEHRYEKWANFPAARKRLLDLLVTTQPRALFFISGDRHIAEFSKMELDGLSYPVYDFTASGMTHTWSSIREEQNTYRVGELLAKKNFGLLTIEWVPKLRVTLEMRGLEDDLLQSEKIEF